MMSNGKQFVAIPPHEHDRLVTNANDYLAMVARLLDAVHEFDLERGEDYLDQVLVKELRRMKSNQRRY